MTDQADIIRNRRRLFAMPGGSHDRVVRFLNQALPAGIGAVVAVIVIAPVFPRGEISFLLDRNKGALANDRLRVEQAMYRGEDSTGRPFSVTAGSAIERSRTVPVVAMRDLSARILLRDGPAELKASTALYDIPHNIVDVAGPIDFRAADGYRMTTSNVRIDLRAQQVTGTGGVAGAVPSGAQSLINAGLPNRVVALKGRAHLRMQGAPGAR